MDDEIAGNDNAIVEAAISSLMQHFDTVQVFVTRQEPGGSTLGFATGRGNHYAILGQVGEWVSNGGVMHLGEDEE